MVRSNPTGQQPMPPSPAPSGPDKEDPNGISEAEKKNEGGKTKYDEPSVGADDFAIDEQREKRIRGNEPPKDVTVPD